MPLLIQYFLKLFISLALVWLFYQLLLRRLTFYNSNRWYLLGYTLLAFFIPFADISAFVEKGNLHTSQFIQIIPSVDTYTIKMETATDCPAPVVFSNWDKWDWMLLVVGAGACLLLMRFAIRFLSYLKLKRQSQLVADGNIKLFHVDKPIIPFSFGNAVFINPALHAPGELKDIVRHEFVHVKQKHTIDILWAEWLCILNWYNPFAWLIKASIRQNLEFIADSKVLENGINKKEYQYLLLKVIGNNHFSIASQFNFSSLKKRIAMMNKMQTARIHLLRFLFILPLLAVVLISFRKQVVQTDKEETSVQVAQTDTIPSGKRTVTRTTVKNSKGYDVSIVDNKGQCTVVVKDAKGKEVERLSLNKWNDNESHYEALYGEIPPVPPTPPTPPAVPEATSLPAHVKNINAVNGKVTVTLKNGKTEHYDLSKEAEKKAFEDKYGSLPEPPTPPTPPQRSVSLLKTDGVDNIAVLCKEYEITDKKAVMHLKDGNTEEYDLTNLSERRQFEKKYGKIINVSEAGAAAPVAVLNHGAGYSVISPMQASVSTPAVPQPPMAIDPNGEVLTGDELIYVEIMKNFTRQQLNEAIAQMKEKGIALRFDEIEYENDQLVRLSGSLKSKDGSSSFSATDFKKLTLSVIKNGDHTYFRVYTGGRKVVI